MPKRKAITPAGLRAALIERGAAAVSLMTFWTTLERLGLLHGNSR